ncbi:phosphatidylinositol phosphatase PTPRQ isoform X2 [Hydra vulgaris]|uniref:phosphatidylinositol phosphatase PTPRQ isoform X2 n=1 Tax=Hydra vulgaris TaxID=6087 RepID=UPI001F5F1190|nr:phosphatidylinositol phosphatase PTPRQ-like isoform X2 [Hydra vulgaris]
MKQKSFNIFLVCFLSCVFGGLIYEACKDNVPSQACFNCTDPVMNQFCQSTCNTCVNINGTNKSVSATSIPFGQPKSGLKYLIIYNDSQNCFLDVRISDYNIYCNSTNWTEFYLVDVPSTISLPSTEILFQGAVSFQSVKDNKYLRHRSMVIRLDNFSPTDYAGDRSYYIHQKDLSFSIQSAHPNYLSHFIGKNGYNFEILQNALVSDFTLVATGLMIKKIESINKYSVNITIILSVPVWNSTADFKIKCKNPNDVNLYLKQQNLYLKPVINYITDISSLQSYTWYKFSAGVKNEFGFYVYGQVFSYRTDEDVPAGYPRNFTVKIVNFTTLFLSWAEVESLMRKGIILNYIYSCNNTEDSLSNKVDNSTFNVTVYNLNPDTIYHCSVAACTRVGCGVQAFVFNITLAGIPSGPPLNFVVAPFSFSSLLLSWDEVEYFKRNGTIISYKYSCSNEINTWYDVDKNTFQVVVDNLTFNTTYNCTIKACTRIGCGVQSSLFNTTLNGYIENSSQIVKTECVEYVGKHNTIINGLDPYTNYTVLVYCKNKAGVGFKDNTKKKSVFTDELPPLVSPKNISVDSNTNSILLQWKPLDQNEYYGVLTGYSIIVKAVYSESDFKIQSKRKRRGLDMQIYNGSLLLEWQTNLSDPNATFFNITSLFGNTIYIINISANTKYQGKFSSGVQIKTKEGVPLLSAVNLQCDIITYCSISIRWQPTPPGYLQGILIGYTLSYQKVDTEEIQYESLNAESTSYNVIKLDAFTNYNIVLIALTKDGGGKNSQLTCKTDDAVPIQPPTGLAATSYYYPDKTNVSWIHINQSDWRGRPLGYTIAYKLLKQGDVDIPNQPWVMINITYTNLSMYQLQNLQLYSQYSLKIAGYNKKGIGSFSGVINFDTCHILNPVVEINYISIPPFANPNNSSQFPPEGIMIAPTEHSLKQCAGICSSFSENISFVYTKVQKTSLEFVKMSSDKIKLPVTVPVQVYNSSYSSTVQLSGFVFLFIPSNTSVQLAENEKLVFKNTASSLATLVIYILLNCLFGVILFYCQYQNSQTKSHCFTLSGIFEEIYFSIITITTVGYGDKIPLTFCGRVSLIVWTFMGIVLTSICVGNIISALTVDVVSSVIDLYPKYTVIAKLGSPEYLWANKISSINLIKDKNFSSHLDVLDGLRAGQAKYAVFDQYTIEAYRVVMMQFNIKVAKVFNTDNSYYGVSLGGNYSLLQSCMNGLLKNSSAMVASAMHDFKIDVMQQTNSTNLKLNKTQVQLFSIQSPIFKMMLSGMAYVLLSLLIAGSVYEILRIKWIKKPRVAPSLDKKVAYLQEMKNLSQEYLIEFHNMVERLQIKTDILLYKHAEQRYKLRNKFSKLYGVNFKYVALNDLGVSLEQIAEFREEIKRRPKKTCWQRFLEYAVKKLSWLRIKIFK